IRDLTVTGVQTCALPIFVANSKKSGPGLYAAQVLVRERLITCADLLGLQDDRATRLYECPHCQHRHAREQLPKDVGERFACRGRSEERRVGKEWSAGGWR